MKKIVLDFSHLVLIARFYVYDLINNFIYEKENIEIFNSIY